MAREADITAEVVEAGARGLHQRDVADPESEPHRREWDLLPQALQDQYREDARAVLRATAERP